MKSMSNIVATNSAAKGLTYDDTIHNAMVFFLKIHEKKKIYSPKIQTMIQILQFTICKS